MLSQFIHLYSALNRTTAMVDSRCQSSQESFFSAVASSFTPPGPLPKPSKRDGSMKIVDFATLNLSLRSSASEENIQSFPQKVGLKKSLPSLFEKTQVQETLTGEQPGSPISPIVRGRQRVRRYTSAGVTRRGLKSPASPDRFIPTREFNDPPSTTFHVSKSPRRLSPEEKLLRRRSPKADPFMPSHPRRSVSAPKPQTERANSPHYAPHMVNDSSVVGGQILTGPNDLLRQISSGAVWNVGGSGAALDRPPLAIPDGTGGLLGSGTTAPMYTAKFLPRTTTTEEREQHESRVALALDIDPATRLLGTSRLWPLLETRPSPSSPAYERLSPFVWKDNAWKRVERDQCKCGILLTVKSFAIYRSDISSNAI